MNPDSLPPIEFTFDWYRTLLKTLHRHGYRFVEYADGLDSEAVVLRHDVDFAPKKAVRIARIESELGVQSTYFFLLSTPLYNVFNKQVRGYVEDIRELGHTVSLHFDGSQYWNEEPADDELAEKLWEEATVMSQAVGEPIEVVSFHNPVGWELEREVEGFVNAYEARFFSDIGYFADSNQRWREDPAFKGSVPDAMQLLTHPVLWDEEDRRKNTLLDDARHHIVDNVDDVIDAARL